MPNGQYRFTGEKQYAKMKQEFQRIRTVNTLIHQKEEIEFGETVSSKTYKKYSEMTKQKDVRPQMQKIINSILSGNIPKAEHGITFNRITGFPNDFEDSSLANRHNIGKIAKTRRENSGELSRKISKQLSELQWFLVQEYYGY